MCKIDSRVSFLCSEVQSGVLFQAVCARDARRWDETTRKWGALETIQEICYDIRDYSERAALSLELINHANEERNVHSRCNPFLPLLEEIEEMLIEDVGLWLEGLD